MHRLVDLVKDERLRLERDRSRYPSVFPDETPIYPIPFFGNLCKAEVLTMALNPSRKEFIKERTWREYLGDAELTDRLIRYFDLPEAPPHPWFERYNSTLSLLGKCYVCNAAHTDLLSYPTKFYNELTKDDHKNLATLVDESIAALERVLGMCKLLKLVIVIDYQLRNFPEGWTTVFEFIQQRVPILAAHIKNAGNGPPVFRGPPETLYRRIHDHRDALREQLKGSALVFSA
jgi:hypothetical protein